MGSGAELAVSSFLKVFLSSGSGGGQGVEDSFALWTSLEIPAAQGKNSRTVSHFGTSLGSRQSLWEIKVCKRLHGEGKDSRTVSHFGPPSRFQRPRARIRGQFHTLGPPLGVDNRCKKLAGTAACTGRAGIRGLFRTLDLPRDSSGPEQEFEDSFTLWDLPWESTIAARN